jgi:hypothetical protein
VRIDHFISGGTRLISTTVRVPDMSFIITLYVQEGIVMASDSRLTVNRLEQRGSHEVQISVPQSDANYKTFLAPGNVGISTFGAADINGIPISGYIDSFISERLSSGTVPLQQIPQLILDYFRSLSPVPDTSFHVAGYTTENGRRIPHVWFVNLLQNVISRINQPGQQGATWGGESDILSRLLNPVGTIGPDKKFNQIPAYPIDWQFFTLQDAIDFAIYAERTTIDSMRFQTREKTVGGPIDVLVIKPDRAFWVAKKELNAMGSALSF